MPTRASTVSSSPEWTGFNDEALPVGGGLQGQSPSTALPPRLLPKG